MYMYLCTYCMSEIMCEIVNTVSSLVVYLKSLCTPKKIDIASKLLTVQSGVYDIIVFTCST